MSIKNPHRRRLPPRRDNVIDINRRFIGNGAAFMKQVFISFAKHFAIAALALPLVAVTGCSEKEITDTVPDPEEEPGPANSDLPELPPKTKKK